MNNHILNLKGISVEKNDVCILEDINLEIKQGDFLNIYGSNGAGKTTLLKLLSGLTEPTAGEIKFNNDDFMDKVFILGHKNGIKLNLTVLENLQFISNDQDIKKIKSVIEKYELTSKMNTLTKYLSHGQQKRVALMKAMINDYVVWLLDEPYSGLDQVGEEILDKILVEHIKKCGVVVITNHKEIKKEKINIKNYKIE
jgi:heme ABC exporter, ATP-binding protein CcmA